GVHHAHAGRRAALLGDAAGGRALDHAAHADEEQLLVLAHDERSGEAALALGQPDRLDAFGSTVRLAVLADLRALAVAVLGHHEQVHVVSRDIHRDHAPGAAHDHPAHVGRVAAYRSVVRLGVATRQPSVGDIEDFIFGVNRAPG